MAIPPAASTCAITRRIAANVGGKVTSAPSRGPTLPIPCALRRPLLGVSPVWPFLATVLAPSGLPEQDVSVDGRAGPKTLSRVLQPSCLALSKPTLSMTKASEGASENSYISPPESFYFRTPVEKYRSAIFI